MNQMKKIIPILLAFFALLALSPGTDSLTFRSHLTLAGSRYFQEAGVYGALTALVKQEIITGTGAEAIENLDIDLIGAGAVVPDTWRRDPYYADKRHLATHSRDQGVYWLQRARDAKLAGAWDNVSYFLGIATHYWGDVITMAHHDNVRLYYEDEYSGELGYKIWDALHDHWESQVHYHCPTLTWGDYENAAYNTLDSYLTNVAIPVLNEFINNTAAEPGAREGWWFEWVDGSSTTHPVLNYGRVRIEVRFPRDCEAAKSSVDLAAILLYNAWIRVLDLQPYFT
jgi:hypothetical protein